ncbi:MAG TPA: hypothetical protein VJ770_08325 [Stellaceae bacterium]|nr:hypothetical protein [Stellaceae bacterium]
MILGSPSGNFASPDERSAAPVSAVREASSERIGRFSKDNAAKRFDQWAAQFNKTKSQVVQGAKQTAGQAADVLSQASIWAFVALLLGAIFSGLGGIWGTQPRISVVEAERIVS